MSFNAKQLIYAENNGWFDTALDSVNYIAQAMGWGWHRANNALKELRLR